MFSKVEQKIDFPAMECRILSWWQSSDIVSKYLNKNNGSSENFSFLDGPITANNPMGVHHAWGRTYKDLWQRYFNMRGFKQRFQNGFDNQGLWVEVEVEKKLGFKSKKDIESYGIEKFVNDCKEHTKNFAKIQTEQSKRLGYFMDWDNSYYTMSDENNYMIWQFLRVCFENGWIYKGRDAVAWCPRCGTAISQHEILQEEYQELTHDSVFLKFSVTDKDFSILVWTTTPWTIPLNVAIAVNPKFIYLEWVNKDSGEKLIALKEDQIVEEEDRKFLKKLFDEKWKVGREIIGEDLVGLRYVGPFDDLPKVKAAKEENPEKFHTIVSAEDMVVANKGTGFIHIAPGAGQEDFQLGKKENLPVIDGIDEAANYWEDFGQFSGQNAKELPELIINFLKDQEKFLYAVVPYKHRYPICWRCKEELVWRVVEEWYISMDELRNKMMEVTKKINWLPSWGKDRELDWLKNMEDWLISKKRYWGLALPIWECPKCKYFEIIGSKEELKEKAISGWEEFEGNSPHRPWVDHVKIKCSKCGETASRIPDVGNPWLDAGIVPFSTYIDPQTKKLSYTTDKKYWSEWFPADFITECFPGQFKNWFYSLIAMSTVLEDSNPFKTILGYALVRDEKGEEMHKSKGNAIWFDEAAEKMGVDVMRWIYVTQNPLQNLNFGYSLADDVRRRFILMLWNTYNFFVTYANIDGVEKLQQRTDNIVSENVLDRWIVSKFNQLNREISESLEKYDAYTASWKIEEFVNDFSTWYVRRSRDRVGPSAEDLNDRDACYQTYFWILINLSKILAPFIPFISEEIYQNLTANAFNEEKSVHLEDWPKLEENLIDEKLHEEMNLARKICEQGNSARKSAGIKVRQPLAKLLVKSTKEITDQGIIQLIKEELNIKELVWQKGKEELEVELDTNLTPDLEEEGKARELVRQIQDLRKEKGCQLSDQIKVYLPDWPEKYTEYIKRQTLSSELIKDETFRIE